MAAPTFNSDWSRLPAGTEIPELRTSTSRTYSNGDGTFTADITPAGGPESVDSCQPTSTGRIEYFYYPPGYEYYYRYSPELHYRRYYYCGYAKFDLTPIPDSSSILSAQFRCYQYEVNTAPLWTECVYPPDVDPDTTSNQALFLAIQNGVQSVAAHMDSTGWVEYNLRHDWLANWQSLLFRNWVALGVYADSGEGSAYGVHGDDKQAYLHIVYLRPDESDIQALRAEPATYPLGAQRPDTALLVLTNRGMCTSGPFWAYASSTSLASDSALVEPIAVGDTASVHIALSLPPVPDIMVDFRLWASDGADKTHSNDSTQLQCWSFPASTYAAEGFDGSVFPPHGWSVANYDGGARCWTRQSDSGGSHSGTGFASSTDESLGNSDDWLMSGPVYPSRDCSDSVGFFARSVTGFGRDTLEVLAVRGASAPVSLLTLDVRDTVFSRHSVSLDTYDGDTIQVAFRHRTRGRGNGICLDDIWFSRIFHILSPETSRAGKTHGPPRDSVRSSNVALPKLAFAQSPASGRFVTVRCSLAVGRMRRLTIRDVAGRAVSTFALNPSGITRLDLRGFPSGVYLATLQGSVPLVSRKLVLAAP
ncbi:MAG TPA: choice-of-anchor J domain-containing protein [bacterium]|nr:choice-of-anchor J domain-containing protein [bacterium]